MSDYCQGQEMQIDRVLHHTEYNLRSKSRLSARDDIYTRVWLGGLHPFYRSYQRLRNRRIINRKEFYESAFVLDRLAPELSRTTTLFELGAGHGLVGLFATVLYPNIRKVVHVDRRCPKAYERLREAIALDFPFVKRRSRFICAEIDCDLNIPTNALVVGIHCCGALSDIVAEVAKQSSVDFALSPCCECRDLLPTQHLRDTTPGPMLPSVVGQVRMDRWRSWGYDVQERRLPLAVTERERVYVARAVKSLSH